MVRKGKQHFMANNLSRNLAEGDLGSVDDLLPDEHLFQVDTVTIWASDIVEYLQNGWQNLGLSKVKQRQLIRKAAPYSLIVG